ncbi:MAG TPA: helix-turn-helix transcriptional regulator [Hyphomonadaceae bacterium]|nr:helix-turn-helix transcriptional regulator [Hyphomonadaceae bacterium]
MRIEEVIGAAYDAVLEPERWPVVLGEASRLIDAEMCALRVMDAQGADLMMMAHGAAVTPEIYAEYRRDWLDKDIHLRKVFVTPSLWNRPAFSELEIVQPEEERRSPYVNEFLTRMGLGRLSGMIWKGDTAFGSVAFHRSLDAPLLTEEGLRLSAMMQPHLMRAARMVAGQQSAHAIGRNVAIAFGAASHAVFLLDDCARIVWLNAGAETLLRGRIVSLDAGSKLRLPQPANRIVDELVGDAIGRGDFGLAPRVSVFDDAGHKVIVRGRVVGRASAPGLVFSRAAILLECAGAPELRTAAHRLQTLFSLTQAEASVAIALTEDQTIASIAASRGVSDETVRSQIKAIFRKLGVSRRTGLIHIVSQLSD